MRKTVFAVIPLVAVAACGADGEPVQPTAQSSINISNHGVGVGTSLSFGSWPLTINLGTQL